MFHRLKIRIEATNVAEIYRKNVRGSIKTSQVFNERTVRNGDISGPLPRGGLRGMVFVCHFFFILDEESVSMYGACSVVYKVEVVFREQAVAAL